jgi:hypothetical protein
MLATRPNSGRKSGGARAELSRLRWGPGSSEAPRPGDPPPTLHRSCSSRAAAHFLRHQLRGHRVHGAPRSPSPGEVKEPRPPALLSLFFLPVPAPGPAEQTPSLVRVRSQQGRCAAAGECQGHRAREGRGRRGQRRGLQGAGGAQKPARCRERAWGCEYARVCARRNSKLLFCASGLQNRWN